MITAEIVHTAFNLATSEANQKAWADVSDEVKERYVMMATYLNAQAANEMEHLEHVIEMLRTLIRDFVTFVECDPPTLKRRYEQWCAERDALITRGRAGQQGKVQNAK